MSPALLFAFALISADPNVKPTHHDTITRSSVQTSHAIRESPTSTLTQYGSGTVIEVKKDAFYILTCAHIARHQGQYAGGDLRVITHDGHSLPAELLYRSTIRDLGLIRVKVPSGKKVDVVAAKMATEEKYPAGLKLIKCGYPHGEKRVIATGEATAIESFEGSDPRIRSLIATCPSISGDSGGGVFRASDGRMIGVIYGGSKDGLHATRLREIRYFLAESKKRGW